MLWILRRSEGEPRMKHILEKLEERRARARAGGGQARIEAQHKRGKLTARERLELLMDKGSFEEFDMFVEHRSADFGMEKSRIPGDGVVTGWGTVNGRTVFAFAKAFTVLGGAAVHTTKSGIADGSYENDVECLLQMRRLLDFLPANNEAGVPEWPSHDDIEQEEKSLDTLVPDNPNKPYDIKELVLKVADEGDFFELQEAFAKNVVTGFGRIAGRTVGFVANQPMVLAGVLDIDASRKAARFVRFCDAFGIPIVTFVDVPGFLPGTNQEYGALIKHGAKLLFAYSQATVPLVTVITRKAFGGAYDVMASKHIGGDVNYAWPTAQIAVMGAKGAVEIIFRADIGDSDKIAARTREYEDRFLSPFVAAERGYIDDVIMPHATRARIARALAMLRGKCVEMPGRKHDNLPL